MALEIISSTDVGWSYIIGIRGNLLVEYDYERLILIHNNVVSTLKVMFPLFTREMFDLLGIYGLI